MDRPAAPLGPAGGNEWGNPPFSRRTTLRFLAGGGLALAGLAAGRGTRDAREVVPDLDGGSGGGRPGIHVFYSDTYTLSGYSFETTRKARWVAEALARDPVPGLALVAPAPVEEADLLATHDPRYVGAVRTGEPSALAESQGFVWDAGLWPMVLASNGGAVAAALAALRDGVAGSLSSGLHHAARGGGKGFCTFNGLALAARRPGRRGAARAGPRPRRALWWGYPRAPRRRPGRLADRRVGERFRYLRAGPARHARSGTPGGGLSPHGRAPPERAGDAASGLRPLPLQRRHGSARRLSGGGLAGIDGDILAARERLVFDWCRRQRLPVAFVLAGGYIGPRLDAHGLTGLHRLTLTTAAGGAR